MSHPPATRRVESQKPGRAAAAGVGAARVAVYVVKLGSYLDYADRLDTLPNDERQRAEGMTSLERCTAFVATRILLRELLAARLGFKPQEIPIVLKPDGKPHLACGRIEFSLSHPEGWCAVALSSDCPVGVDLEPIRALPGWQKVAAEFFPPRAHAALRYTVAGRRQAEFFRWWTCLEAAAKAFGLGLDVAASCLDRVRSETCEVLPGLAIAVAAPAPCELVVDWHMPGWPLGSPIRLGGERLQDGD